MHARVFEIESEKDFIKNEDLTYDLPEWWVETYSDWYDEEEEKDSKKSLDWLAEMVDVEGDMVDFGGQKAKDALLKAYEKARQRAEDFLSLSLEDFSGYAGLDKVHLLSKEVEDKFSHWFYIDGCDMCTLDEMLHRGGKFHLTGRTWDYHW